MIPEKSPWLKFDYVLLFTTLCLIVYGLLLISSATTLPPGQAWAFWDNPVTKQVVYAAIGLVLMTLVAVVDYRILGFSPAGRALFPGAREEEFEAAGLILHHEQYSPHPRLRERFDLGHFLAAMAEGLLNPFYLINLGLLVLVLLVGQSTLGARRWIDLKLFPLQPSELAKFLLIVALARFLAANQEQIGHFVYLVGSLLLVGIPILLIFREPDLGTAVILAVVWLGMVVVAGARLRHITIVGLVGLLSSPLVWFFLLSAYQKRRLFTFLNPQADPLGDGYNVIQSLISVGAGGWFGRGLGSGTQSQLHFLRIQHTDFIFSVLAEELGFVGALFLFSLFIVVLMRGVRIATSASDSFGQLLASGAVVLLLFQVWLNVGMNIGLLPVTGVPLPFISAGGSSLLSMLMIQGLLESVAVHRRRRDIVSRDTVIQALEYAP
jgi:rod shape determining protein RodA